MTTQTNPPLPGSAAAEKALQATISKSKLLDATFMGLGIFCLGVALLALLAMIGKLLFDGSPKLGLDFLFSFPSSKPTQAGVYSAWVGSGLVIIVTTLAAVPMGVAAAIYLEEYAKKGWLSDVIEINVSNLAGVPSIIYGLLGLGLFKYGLGLGQSIATAGLTLALLVLPIVIVTTREGIRAIPSTIREAAYAVGATKWQVIWDHILPYSTGTILTGVIVAVSRAFGETAPLITIGAMTFIAFLPDSPIQSSFPFISFSWLLSGFTVLPIQMFDWVGRPDPEFQKNAAAAGIVIISMTLLMNGLAIYLRYRLRKSIKW